MVRSMNSGTHISATMWLLIPSRRIIESFIIDSALPVPRAWLECGMQGVDSCLPSHHFFIFHVSAVSPLHVAMFHIPYQLGIER